MKALYVLAMTIAFSEKVNGSTTWYYGRLIICLILTVIWFMDIMRRDKIIKSNEVFCLGKYMLPYCLILLWSILIWKLNPPEAYESAYLTRCASNILLLLLIVLAALSSVHFWGKKAIELSAYSIMLSVVVNMLIVIPQYGLGIFWEYLQSVLGGDFVYGSVMEEFADKMEIQGPTMAAGAYLIYFLFFDDVVPRKRKKILILLLLLCVYLGFKRTVVFAAIVTGIVCLIFKIPFNRNIYKIGLCALAMGATCIIYDVVVKVGLIENISEALNINSMGRAVIYQYVAQFYEFSPWFWGNGFGYVSKYLYDRIGFVAHSEIVRMLADIGFIPYLIWLYHYLFGTPSAVYKRFGINAGKIVLAFTCYLFSTYFMENTLVCVAMQFSYLTICMSECQSEYRKVQNEHIG